MSLEAFLIYNDLLAWNEDCKYHYRSVQKNSGWIGNVGRPNTLRTHVSVIGTMVGKVSFVKLLEQAARTRGVAPCTHKDALSICGFDGD